MRKPAPALVTTLLLLASVLAAVAPPAAGGADGDRWGTGDPPSSFEYVVVAPGDWERVLEPLMDWRERTSRYDPVYLSLEDAIADGQGRDDAARLKWSIARVPEEEEGHKVLLLAGDADIIPVRRVFTDILQDGNVSDPLNFRWTDDYYAFGDELQWDSDGDGVYGEDGEVLRHMAGALHPTTAFWSVGRVPASDPLELERFVDKVLAYERDPPAGDWYTSALLVSGLMDVPNHLDNPYTPDIDGGYELFSDNSYESHAKLRGLLPERYDVTWLYDYPRLEGGDWNLSVDTLDHASMVRAFDRGHSVMAMNGHGWVDGTGLAHYNGSGVSDYWWDWSNAFDYRDADAARNGGRLPWAYVAACYVGDVTLEDDRTLERLVMNPDGGAIGLVAGNGENYKGESMANASYGNWFLERTFWAHYFRYGPGMSMQFTKWLYLDLVSGDGVPHTDLYDAYYAADYLSHNLLGDPLTRVWTDAPGQLHLSHFLDIYEHGRDGVFIAVTDDGGRRVHGAHVDVRWDGGAASGTTDDGLWLTVPLDAGDLQVTVSANNHLPLEAWRERPVEQQDLELAALRAWPADGGRDDPVDAGQEVLLTATVEVHGRYGFDRARVHMEVAPEGGEFQRLIPDLFVDVQTGARPHVERTWTPPHAGLWTLRAEVDPDDQLPDANPADDFLVATLVVRGPPEWAQLPDPVDLGCGEGPAASLDLLPYLSDPDTPRGELELTAEVLEGDAGLLRARVDDAGRLWVCPAASRAAARLRLTASDGAFEASAELRVNVTRDAGAMRLVAPGPYHLRAGDAVTGQVVLEDLGSPDAADVVVAPVDEDPGLVLGPDGSFRYTAQAAGLQRVRLGIFRADGTTEPSWEGALLAFHVAPANELPPMLLGPTDLELAEGERARLLLQAVDLEGDDVTITMLDDDGLDAILDPHTGLLTLHPREGDAGRHEVVVRLFDGELHEDATLQVRVVDAPASEGTGLVGLLYALALVAGAALVWALYRGRRG